VTVLGDFIEFSMVLVDFYVKMSVLFNVRKKKCSERIVSIGKVGSFIVDYYINSQTYLVR
jgi:hypothetical protein